MIFIQFFVEFCQTNFRKIKKWQNILILQLKNSFWNISLSYNESSEMHHFCFMIMLILARITTDL